MSLEIKILDIPGYEKVIEAQDFTTGLHAFIAVHSTTLGPSLGGTRIFPYLSREQALNDVLHLSKGMTYKSALAEIGLGGGKSVIIADPKRQKTPELLQSFAQAVHSLKGLYICAEDVGSTPKDMAQIRKTTPYVAALPHTTSSGDPSPFTAWGCLQGMEAVADTLWFDRSLKGHTVAIQGLGAVGFKLAEFLFWRGAHLIVADLDPEKEARAKMLFGAQIAPIKRIHSVECDIFAPCAMGAAINEQTIDQIEAAAIAGCANNQLQTPQLAEKLQEKQILYAPDFVINAGGIINAAAEYGEHGYYAPQALHHINQIYDTLRAVFETAEIRELSPYQIANEIAESKIACGIGKRKESLPLAHIVD